MGSVPADTPDRGDDTADSPERIPFRRRLGHGVGDIFGGGSGTLISFFYLVFLKDVVRIAPGQGRDRDLHQQDPRRGD